MFRRSGASIEFVADWQIGDALLRLVTQAQHRLTLVSPYNKHWGHLKREVSAARVRGVAVTVYYRADEPNPVVDYADVAGIPVRMLHAKIYASESAALVTTMNLVETSATYSREVGFLLRDARLRKEVDQYIKTLEDGADPTRASDAGIVRRNGFPAQRQQVENATDIARIMGDSGFCIECDDTLQFNRERPLCYSCYSRFGKNGTHSRCHKCGEPHATSLNQPLCPICADTQQPTGA